MANGNGTKPADVKLPEGLSLDGMVRWLATRMATWENRFEDSLSGIDTKLDEAREEFRSQMQKQTESYIRAAKKIDEALGANALMVQELRSEMRVTFSSASIIHNKMADELTRLSTQMDPHRRDTVKMEAVKAPKKKYPKK